MTYSQGRDQIEGHGARLWLYVSFSENACRVLGLATRALDAGCGFCCAMSCELLDGVREVVMRGGDRESEAGRSCGGEGGVGRPADGRLAFEL